MAYNLLAAGRLPLAQEPPVELKQYRRCRISRTRCRVAAYGGLMIIDIEGCPPPRARKSLRRNTPPPSPPRALSFVLTERYCGGGLLPPVERDVSPGRSTCTI